MRGANINKMVQTSVIDYKYLIGNSFVHLIIG